MSDLNRDRYGLTAIFIHWAMAIVIMLLIIVGFYMTSLNPLKPATFQFYQLHKSIGFIAFGLIAIRVINRLLNPPPKLPSSMSQLEKLLAHLGHLALYFCMIAMPLSGWIMVSTSPLNIPTLMFGLFEIPHLPIAGVFGDKGSISSLMATLHKICAYGLCLLITIHIAAALKHHFYSKDKVLLRILVSKRRTSQSEE
ncbi:cytochrome b [Polycladidibacter stylochi]|uniref:cytochrome b n=1 Tax=Polycladidibacter stylochi TaxID=1807766 RepID=UPI0008369796|nr:cytochrome b [Pseudovibrio stylochi]